MEQKGKKDVITRQPNNKINPESTNSYFSNYENLRNFNLRNSRTEYYPPSVAFPEAAAEAPLTRVPVGLELLIPLNLIFVKQDKEVIVLADIWKTNRYQIISSSGKRIYIAADQTTGCCAISDCSTRPFKIQILDSSERTFLQMNRPCDPLLYACCGCVGGGMTVDLGDGTRLGDIVHKITCSSPHYDIRDASRKTILRIEGPKGRKKCCAPPHIEFNILTIEGEVVGCIRRKFHHISKDNNNFGAEFHQELDVKWKALTLSAVFLIDLMYFRDNEGGPGSNVIMGHHSTDSSSSTLFPLLFGFGFYPIFSGMY